MSDTIEKLGISTISIKSHLFAAIEKIDKMYTESDEYLGLTTGLSDFDKLVGGLPLANLIVIGGRPSMGKTTLAMNIMEHVALKCEKTVIFFSLESEPELLALRFLSALGKVDAHSLMTRELPDDDWPKVTPAVSMLSKAPIYIRKVMHETIDEILVQAQEIAALCDNVGLIVIDYIQLLCRTSSSPEHKAAELSIITRKLKTLAKELNVPVIAVSQLSRYVEERSNKRPVMSDLRDAGSIEDDADMVCFVYREDYYNEASEEDKGVAELIVAKHRNGPIGTVKTAYMEKYYRFEDL